MASPELPSQVLVRACESESRDPISGLVVGLTVLVPRKNNYGIGPRITDAAGNALFSVDEISREIELNKRVFLMDYSCDLSQAVGLAAWVANRRQIDNMLEFSRQWGRTVPEWRLSDDMIDKLSKCDNDAYEACTVSVDIGELRRHPAIEITFLQRPAGSNSPQQGSASWRASSGSSVRLMPS